MPPSQNSAHGGPLWQKTCPLWGLPPSEREESLAPPFVPPSISPSGLPIGQTEREPAAPGAWEKQPTGVSLLDLTEQGKNKEWDLREKSPKTHMKLMAPSSSNILKSLLRPWSDPCSRAQFTASIGDGCAFHPARDAKNIGFWALIFLSLLHRCKYAILDSAIISEARAYTMEENKYLCKETDLGL